MDTLSHDSSVQCTRSVKNLLYISDSWTIKIQTQPYFREWSLHSNFTIPHMKHFLVIKHFSQFSSVAQSCLTLCDPMDCSMPGHLVHHQLPEFLLKLMSIESVMPSNHLILCRPLLLLSSIFPSIRAFSNESVLCIRWPEYWSISFNTSPSNEYLGFPFDGLVGSPCSPKDSQESSPTPHFKSINSSAFSLLHSPTHIHRWLLEKTEPD